MKLSIFDFLEIWGFILEKSVLRKPISQSLATVCFFIILVAMASRSRKSTTRGPSSSTRSNVITKRHLDIPNGDLPFV
ncbi:hypothetical protein PJP08_29505, partial [Mycobacterium kansasii]